MTKFVFFFFFLLHFSLGVTVLFLFSFSFFFLFLFLISSIDKFLVYPTITFGLESRPNFQSRGHVFWVASPRSMSITQSPWVRNYRKNIHNVPVVYIVYIFKYERIKQAYYPRVSHTELYSANKVPRRLKRHSPRAGYYISRYTYTMCPDPIVEKSRKIDTSRRGSVFMEFFSRTKPVWRVSANQKIGLRVLTI